MTMTDIEKKMLLLFAGDTRRKTLMRLCEYMETTEIKENQLIAACVMLKLCGFESDEQFLNSVEDLKLEVYGYNDTSDEV